MNLVNETSILKVLEAHSITNKEVIQNLWSDYGQILRLEIDDGAKPSVILKQIDLSPQSQHPRGWNTTISHQRKLKSYQVEMYWYAHWVKDVLNEFKVPKCLFTSSNETQQLILLEDLDAAGFPVRKSELNFMEAKVVLKWLAQLHGKFLNQEPKGLWEEGSYWYLSTRMEERNKMNASDLKAAAKTISNRLKNAKYQTIIHGDAKVANFCFSGNGKNTAAVDFQYVGKGCGMKDVAYFVGSCFTEEDCKRYESEVLAYYFLELSKSTSLSKEKFEELEKEWRSLYSWAWADFTRFITGWMPTHQKLNGYAKYMVNLVLNEIVETE